MRTFNVTPDENERDGTSPPSGVGAGMETAVLSNAVVGGLVSMDVEGALFSSIVEGENVSPTTVEDMVSGKGADCQTAAPALSGVPR